jgi:peptidoglycan-associated lipoprotein
MTRQSLLILCIVSAFAIAGCGSSTTLPEDGADREVARASGSSGAGASTTGLGAGGAIDAAREAERQRLLENLVVYFDFDRSDIRQDSNNMLAAHAEYLSANPRAQVRLEGHTDERGSREYNIGLGERRAQAVRRYLILQGVSAEQLSTVSYGEERPAAFGSDEESWSLNRRVELVYR